MTSAPKTRVPMAFAVSVAPMMDWTDRHCRVFHRSLSARARLYTEMVVADAVIHGPRERLLGFSEIEHPVALQIGGSDAGKLAEATRIGAGFGYDEINLNVGCPSDRVQSGRFGACLMLEPETVAAAYTAMADATDVPVTVKCRLGVDDQDVERTLPEFLRIVSAAGCTHFTVHARKAWLQGLSPKQNRNVPPLDYGLVRAMKLEFPNLTIELNGGLKGVEEAVKAARGLDGVMFGRAAYQDPWMLTEVDALYGQTVSAGRDEVIGEMIDYAHACDRQGVQHRALARHMLGLFHGQPGARSWRRAISEGLADGLETQTVLDRARAALAEVASAA